MLLCLINLTGCTYASMTLKDGTKVRYFDLHPSGAAVDARGVWEGVGQFEVTRDTEDSGEFAGAITEGIVEGLSPINVR